MARRSFWKGYLKLSLVTCPVTMSPATSGSEKVRFHTLNRATGNRVEARYVDAETGRPVKDEDEVKGYEIEPGRSVLLEDDELDAVALESTRTIDIDMFVPKESIASLWYDTPHFLVPDDEVGEEAFSVIREAMQATGMNGIARLVLYRRERAVMLEPRGKGIVLWTLRYGDEVRPPKEYFERRRHAEAGQGFARPDHHADRAPRARLGPVHGRRSRAGESAEADRRPQAQAPAAEEGEGGRARAHGRQRHLHHRGAEAQPRGGEGGAEVKTYLFFPAGSGFAAARKSSHGSASRLASRVGALSTVYCAALASWSSSSQVTGIDTAAPARARVE